MAKKTIAAAVAISLLGLSSAAFADPHGRDYHDRGHDRGNHHENWHDARGPVPHRDWHRGDRLPAEYRGYNYTVEDWRGHGLSAPPRGYHWVGVNGDYVLAAIATGVIASVLLSGR
jgi:Ni/Co efflux regulator RcnB